MHPIHTLTTITVVQREACDAATAACRNVCDAQLLA
jgi:hypothetical protein